MFSLLLLSVPLIQEPASATEAEPVVQESEVLAKLRERVDQLNQAKNYTFRVLSTSESTGMQGGRGGNARGQRGQGRQARGQQGSDRPAPESDRPQQGGEAPATPQPPQPSQPPQPWEGVYQSGKPVLMKQGETQVVRNSDGRMAMKSGEGSWSMMSMPGRGGQGRGGQRGQGGGMDREAMRTLFQVRSVRLPHEMLGTVLEGVDGDQLVREEKLGLVVFHGPLTEEAAMQLASGGRAMGGRGGFGGRGGNADAAGEGPQMLSKGKVRIAFAADGKTVDLMLEAEMMGTFGEREFSRSTKSEIRAGKIGESEMDVPREAMSALSQDPALEEEF